jgi:hypothetical protein
VQDGSGHHAVGSWGIAVNAILWAVSFGDWAADEGQQQSDFGFPDRGLWLRIAELAVG